VTVNSSITADGKWQQLQQKMSFSVTEYSNQGHLSYQQYSSYCFGGKLIIGSTAFSANLI